MCTVVIRLQPSIKGKKRVNQEGKKAGDTKNRYFVVAANGEKRATGRRVLLQQNRAGRLHFAPFSVLIFSFPL